MRGLGGNMRGDRPGLERDVHRALVRGPNLKGDDVVDLTPYGPVSAPRLPLLPSSLAPSLPRSLLPLLLSSS
eukprot:2040501-Rhodomonas_salina.1